MWKNGMLKSVLQEIKGLSSSLVESKRAKAESKTRSRYKSMLQYYMEGNCTGKEF